MKYTAQQIKKWNVGVGMPGGRIIPARSLNYTVESWCSRIRNAWGVLIGKYDALDWEDGGNGNEREKKIRCRTVVR